MQQQIQLELPDYSLDYQLYLEKLKKEQVQENETVIIIEI
jgi:hypothetical protein